MALRENSEHGTELTAWVVTVRVRVCAPPHVAEHVDQADQVEKAHGVGRPRVLEATVPESEVTMGSAVEQVTAPFAAIAVMAFGDVHEPEMAFCLLATCPERVATC